MTIREPYKRLSDYIRRTAFGSDRDRDRFHDLCRTARDTQRVHLAVPPMTALEVVRGGTKVLLQQGAEVMLSDLVAGVTVQASLERLKDHLGVIERHVVGRDPDPLGAA